MSTVAFHEAARQYAAAGIASLPLGGEDGKRPLVKRWGRFGIKASLKIAPKFQDANLGFVCGRRSNLTVVDIDSADESELRWTQDTFGPSPIIVRTGSGKFHAWYRHNGERRRIRPIEGHPIDLLGEGGYCAAPPSVRPNGGKYEFLQGNLDRVADLPTIRPDAMDWFSARPSKAAKRPANDVVIEGTRNDSLFDLARPLAWNATSHEAFLIELRKANAEINQPPLPDAEVERTAARVWQYKLEGRLFLSGRQRIILDGDTMKPLIAAGDLDAIALLLCLRQTHGHTAGQFAAAPKAMASARVIGSWDHHRYRSTLRRLCESGLLERVYGGGKGPGDPAQYRFAKG
jgi:hypothetical protein